MAIAHQFDYVKPASLGEAVKVLAKFGSRAQALAGGTDLIRLIVEDFVEPELVVDIKGIPGLDKIRFKNNVLTIGALTTFSDLRSSQVIARKFPVIREMTGWVASNGIRNRATLVGNLCSAVPCCDSGPVLQVYGATILVTGPGGKRSIPVNQWFLGPRKTALTPGEMATGVRVPLPKKKHAACFVKLRRYQGEDLAQASVTIMALAGNEYRVSFGSVAPAPLRGLRIEKLLNGRSLSEALIRQAVSLVRQEITPITDIRSSKEYRALMVEVMLERGLKAAVARLQGNGPDYGTSLI
jgi:CO/xanthine dehydrogenase FAD-binding subunit